MKILYLRPFKINYFIYNINMTLIGFFSWLLFHTFNLDLKILLNLMWIFKCGLILQFEGKGVFTFCPCMKRSDLNKSVKSIESHYHHCISKLIAHFHRQLSIQDFFLYHLNFFFQFSKTNFPYTVIGGWYNIDILYETINLRHIFFHIVVFINKTCLTFL